MWVDHLSPEHATAIHTFRNGGNMKNTGRTRRGLISIVLGTIAVTLIAGVSGWAAYGHHYKPNKHHRRTTSTRGISTTTTTVPTTRARLS
jgi:hypothetical protein